MQRPIYIRQLAQTFNENMAGIVIENDNMPSILMIKILGAMRRSKIIEIRHQYIRGKIKKNSIQLKQTPSEKLKAEILTKPLERIRLNMLKQNISVEHIPEEGQAVMTEGKLTWVM